MLIRSVGSLVSGFAAFSVLLGSARADGYSSCKTINSIAYCKEVDSLGYSHPPSSGQYDDVVDVDVKGCVCKKATKTFSGPLGPFSEDLSFHVRGPIRFKQFAAYTLSKPSKAKREHLRRHAHGHMHRRDVIKTEVVTYATTIYTTVDPSEPTPPSGDGAPAPKVYKENTPTPPKSSKPPKESPSDTPKDTTPDTSGAGWNRVAYYNSGSKTAQGLVFLNHFGGSGSGFWDQECFGNSLSYANSALTGGAAGPEIPDDVTLKSGDEFAIFSDTPCKGNDCGYFPPGTPAYRGWGGGDKALLFEFSMPRDTAGSGISGDLPAIWLLNAKIARVAQYGTKGGECSCWPACGEFDVFEALTGTASEPARDMMKTHVHCAQGSTCGGNMDYFGRPLQDTIKMAVVLTGSNMYVTKLDDKTTFDKVLPENLLSECQKTQSIFALS